MLLNSDTVDSPHVGHSKNVRLVVRWCRGMPTWLNAFAGTVNEEAERWLAPESILRAGVTEVVLNIDVEVRQGSDVSSDSVSAVHVLCPDTRKSTIVSTSCSVYSQDSCGTQNVSNTTTMSSMFSMHSNKASTRFDKCSSSLSSILGPFPYQEPADEYLYLHSRPEQLRLANRSVLNLGIIRHFFFNRLRLTVGAFCTSVVALSLRLWNPGGTWYVNNDGEFTYRLPSAVHLAVESALLFVILVLLLHMANRTLLKSILQTLEAYLFLGNSIVFSYALSCNEIESASMFAENSPIWMTCWTLREIAWMCVIVICFSSESFLVSKRLRVIVNLFLFGSYGRGYYGARFETEGWVEGEVICTYVDFCNSLGQTACTASLQILFVVFVRMSHDVFSHNSVGLWSITPQYVLSSELLKLIDSGSDSLNDGDANQNKHFRRTPGLQPTALTARNHIESIPIGPEHIRLRDRQAGGSSDEMDELPSGIASAESHKAHLSMVWGVTCVPADEGSLVVPHTTMPARLCCVSKSLCNRPECFSK